MVCESLSHVYLTTQQSAPAQREESGHGGLTGWNAANISATNYQYRT